MEKNKKLSKLQLFKQCCSKYLLQKKQLILETKTNKFYTIDKHQTLKYQKYKKSRQIKFNRMIVDHKQQIKRQNNQNQCFGKPYKLSNRIKQTRILPFQKGKISRKSSQKKIFTQYSHGSYCLPQLNLDLNHKQQKIKTKRFYSKLPSRQKILFSLNSSNLLNNDCLNGWQDSKQQNDYFN